MTKFRHQLGDKESSCWCGPKLIQIQQPSYTPDGLVLGYRSIPMLFHYEAGLQRRGTKFRHKPRRPNFISAY